MLWQNKKRGDPGLVLRPRPGHEAAVGQTSALAPADVVRSPSRLALAEGGRCKALLRCQQRTGKGFAMTAGLGRRPAGDGGQVSVPVRGAVRQIGRRIKVWLKAGPDRPPRRQLVDLLGKGGDQKLGASGQQKRGKGEKPHRPPGCPSAWIVCRHSNVAGRFGSRPKQEAYSGAPDGPCDEIVRFR